MAAMAPWFMAALPASRSRRSCGLVPAELLHRVERVGEPLFLAVVARPLPAARTPDAGRAVAPDQASGGILAGDVVDHEVLGDDDVALHAHHLGDVRDAPRAVAQARGLYDHVDRRADHLPDGARGQREAAHGDHGLDARQAFARAVGVQRAHRAVVARVHGLQEVEGLRSARLAHDDALGPHAQAVAHEVAHGDLALAFEVRRAGFETHHMGLLELKLRRVLAGDDALVGLDVAGEA